MPHAFREAIIAPKCQDLICDSVMWTHGPADGATWLLTPWFGEQMWVKTRGWTIWGGGETWTPKLSLNEWGILWICGCLICYEIFFFISYIFKRSEVLGPLQNHMIPSTCYINIHFTSTVSEMLQLWACCTTADSSVLCVHIPLAKQNTVSHCKRTTVLFSTWALLKLRHFFLFFPLHNT